MEHQKRIEIVRAFVGAMETSLAAAKRYLTAGIVRRDISGETRPVYDKTAATYIEVDEAEREASEWIARLNADDISPDDRVRFEAWRKLHPRHARAYDELSATWRELTAASSSQDTSARLDLHRCGDEPGRRL